MWSEPKFTRLRSLDSSQAEDFYIPSFIFNVSRRQAPARAARRVLDGESVEESWNQVNFMVMSYDAVRRQAIGM